MALVEAPAIVSRWSSFWPLGPSPAVSSVLDVLCGDVLEEEGRLRPGDPVVVGRDRIDGDALAHWTLDFPAGPRRGLAALFDRAPAKLLARITRLGDEAVSRRASFEEVLGAVETAGLAVMADMEVISLAMGHYGPPRQPKALPVIEGALVSIAATVAASQLLERGRTTSATVRSIASLGAACATAYDPAFRSLARFSADAFEDLARRATARGIKTAGPWSLPVTAWVPTLAAAAK